MNSSRKTSVMVALALLLIATAAFCKWGVSADSVTRPRQRSFVFTYDVHVPGNPAAQGPSKLWIPLPQSDAHQTVQKLTVSSPVRHVRGTDLEYGNAFLVFTPTAEQSASGYEATLQFEVTRSEFSKDLNAAPRSAALRSELSDPMLQRYLQPDKLVPLNATIAALSREKTQGASDALEKARRIYTYVATTMRYDKSGEGWGRGDAMWACDSKRGNCTDFHSVLIGMLRSSGIPARFEIGFPIPEGKTEGDIAGYHCWAEFYLDGIGWVPVDASEASKNPAKRDYFFGSVDADRVRFTYGRDIRLAGDQKGEPLNYFVYPYAEANGQVLKDIKTRFAFRDIPPSGTAAGH